MWLQGTELRLSAKAASTLNLLSYLSDSTSFFHKGKSISNQRFLYSISKTLSQCRAEQRQLGCVPSALVDSDDG